jgi:hypothetical protein
MELVALKSPMRMNGTVDVKRHRSTVASVAKTKRMAPTAIHKMSDAVQGNKAKGTNRNSAEGG